MSGIFYLCSFGAICFILGGVYFGKSKIQTINHVTDMHIQIQKQKTPLKSQVIEYQETPTLENQISRSTSEVKYNYEFEEMPVSLEEKNIDPNEGIKKFSPSNGQKEQEINDGETQIARLKNTISIFEKYGISKDVFSDHRSTFFLAAEVMNDEYYEAATLIYLSYYLKCNVELDSHSLPIVISNERSKPIIELILLGAPFIAVKQQIARIECDDLDEIGISKVSVSRCLYDGLYYGENEVLTEQMSNGGIRLLTCNIDGSGANWIEG